MRVVMDTQSGQRNCEEDSEMNFAAFSAMGAGTHFVTTNGQLPVTTKLQQNPNNGSQLPQVVGMVGGVNMGEGVQYLHSLDGTALQATPQLISVPIALPGAKPGDPQPTVQIRVLSPNIIQQQQPKYQMQIPIQGFQQGGTVFTVAYSPEANDGIQLLGNSLPEGTFRIRPGLQVVTAMPQDMQQLMQSQDNKEQVPQTMQHQVFITQNQQIVISNGEDVKQVMNNNTTNNNNNNDVADIIIKEEECEDNDDDDSQGTENSDGMPWQLSSSQQDLVKYLNTLPPQQTQALPVSLQQFLRLNPAEAKKMESIEVELTPIKTQAEDKKDNADVSMDEGGGAGSGGAKKKKKYKKKGKGVARPKPGQVIIATAADGSPIFCCPECQLAYPDKEQLEAHLAVHKIERRFICGICGAGLKRKEHLERHKLGHNPERPYVCGVCGKGFKRREHLNLHVVIHSGVKSELCGECGKGFYRKDHLRKHTRSHETKRARDEAGAEPFDLKPAPQPLANSTALMPEITIHVPTSSNMQVPVQINIPQHVMSSLAAAQARGAPSPGAGGPGGSGGSGSGSGASSGESQLDALLAQHT
ncbi:zinc finger protein with KRAB and SCAN domains 8-like isoform X2 [Colias croceus]|uniref:zinc finger protein with KRAB and SCAN domains 8-like isoform X2 n=1 Tax=Colias crocea TaxID=72248 RepID=UPI001E27DE39|nr:zinc finger protein with KRAB and SCAN domains 8-like isoform X2 [Colias croceus]